MYLILVKKMTECSNFMIFDATVPIKTFLSVSFSRKNETCVLCCTDKLHNPNLVTYKHTCNKLCRYVYISWWQTNIFEF